jgi:transketolase
MRKAFIQELTQLAKEDDRIVLLTGDLGYTVLEEFRDTHPTRLVNVGVMEQTMVGLATGLALRGMIPFVYSITTFATLRPYEFIRNGPGAHNLPVRVVGVGSGVEYAQDGLTHYALEDVTLMRTLPAMTIVAPGDRTQAQTALRQTWNLPGPIYYRLSKFGDKVIPKINGKFTLKEVELLRTGKDCLLVSSGPLTSDVYQAADQLQAEGVDCAVAMLSTIQPLNQKELLFLLSGYKHVFTFEAHYPHGGIGSLISETVADHNLKCQVTRSGLNFTPKQTVGSQNFFYKRHGLDVPGMKQTILSTLKEK